METGVMYVKQCTLTNGFHQWVINNLSSKSALLNCLALSIQKVEPKITTRPNDIPLRPMSRSTLEGLIIGNQLNQFTITPTPPTAMMIDDIQMNEDGEEEQF
jgi:hypothetical protein